MAVARLDGAGPSLTAAPANADPWRRPRDDDRVWVLHLVHEPGPDPGGIERHLAALCDELSDQVASAVLRPTRDGASLTVPDGRGPGSRLLFPRAAPLDERLEDPESVLALRLALQLVDPDAVHLHQLGGHSPGALAALRGFGGPVVASVHDYQLICPNFSLLEEGRAHCGVPDDLRVCGRCARRTIPPGELRDIARYRALVAADLDVIDHWVVFSESSRHLLERAYPLPGDRVSAIPHATLVRPDPITAPPALEPEVPLRLAFVGRGTHKKGLTVVNLLADAVADDGIEIHHLGPLRAPASSHLVCHGAYEHGDLVRHLRDLGISVVLAPGPFAETFGFVLSEAFAAGLPVIVADVGAQGERVRATGAGWAVPDGDVDAVVELVRRLGRDRRELAGPASAARAVEHHSVTDDARRYLDLYRSSRSEPDGADPELDLAGVVTRLAAAAAVVDDRCRAAGARVDTRRGDRAVLDAGPVIDVELVRHGKRLAVVEGDVVRVVRSPLVAAALIDHLGRPMAIDDERWEALGRGRPVDVLRRRDGSPCVVVGGRRHTLDGLPTAHDVDPAVLHRLPPGPTLRVRRDRGRRAASDPDAGQS